MYVLKRYPKDIFVTAHTEKLEEDLGVREERIFVKGEFCSCKTDLIAGIS